MSNKENFVFLASWYDAIAALEASNGREFANEFARQIIDYGVTGKLTTDDQLIVGLVNAMCATLIDKSKSRYRACVANGKKGGKPAQYNPEEIAAFHASGLSDQEIADKMGCSLRTVQRALVAIDDEI